MSRGASGACPPVRPAKTNGGGHEAGDLEGMRQAMLTLGEHLGLVIKEQARLTSVNAKLVLDQQRVSRDQAAIADRSTEVLDKLDKVLDALGSTNRHVDRLTTEVRELRAGRPAT